MHVTANNSLGRDKAFPLGKAKYCRVPHACQKTYYDYATAQLFYKKFGEKRRKDTNYWSSKQTRERDMGSRQRHIHKTIKYKINLNESQIQKQQQKQNQRTKEPNKQRIINRNKYKHMYCLNHVQRRPLGRITLASHLSASQIAVDAIGWFSTKLPRGRQKSILKCERSKKN